MAFEPQYFFKEKYVMVSKLPRKAEDNEKQWVMLDCRALANKHGP